MFVLCCLQVIVVIKEVVQGQQRKTFHPVSSSQAISEAIWSVLKLSAVMDGSQAANHSHTTEWMKVMCRHMLNKVHEATPQLRGLQVTVCGFFNHAVLGGVHGSVTGDDLRGAEPADCAELCAHCELRDKHPASWREDMLATKVWIGCFVVTVNSEASFPCKHF